MKTWQKVAIGVVTIGITGTAIFYGYKWWKGRKKEADKKPLLKVAEVAKKEDAKEKMPTRQSASSPSSAPNQTNVTQVSEPVQSGSNLNR